MRSESAPQVLPDKDRKVTMSELKLFHSDAAGVLLIVFCLFWLSSAIGSLQLIFYGRWLVGVIIGLAVIVITVGSLKAFRRYRLERTLAFLHAEADKASRNAASYFDKVRLATVSIDRHIDNLTRHLESAESALTAHRVATFWDALDDGYRTFAAMSAIFNQLITDTANYRACLEGRRHTYPDAGSPYALDKLDALVVRYQDLVAQADERTDLIEIFERRRLKYGPSFRELKGIASKALQSRDKYNLRGR
jgi:hypothetical protein